MGKQVNLVLDEELKDRSDQFLKKVNSSMQLDSDINCNFDSLDWLDLIEEVCPYLDNIIRTPKVALINETETTKIEKARKTSVDTVKDLSRHTDYIDKIDKNNDVLPSKLLIVRSEETMNTYENRFIYTLVLFLLRYITEKEKALDDMKPAQDKSMTYTGTTTNGKEKISVDIKINTKPTSNSNSESDIEKKRKAIKKRIAGVKRFINYWLAGEMMTSLEKQHAIQVIPPIKKTNLILKNPNFQMATKLWDFLYSEEDIKNGKISGLNSKGDELLRNILDNAFLMDYYVLDSISLTKKEQKEKLCQYAMLMIMNQVQNAVNILLKNGIKITDAELMKLLSIEMNKKKDVAQLGSTEIRKKFQKEMDDYLAKASELL